ncbi:glutamate-5-semialdehyde dehydrogenase [Zobellia galactanivorans]|uniref:Gamma-glutamyl phosphate reductase n=1 Tax=Zobellia galactanivorans (strain DSM 12802 / CCUG 47099 / CIP 106680 / NCIMB 13871 / Dsij) TaxID=63186 RepID=G0L387_ZOBGA|nr:MULTISPECIES: glutamate-5-semialdehyde dehydrogenase [Zobellia]MBU3028232.1 glutamate-5-semialdehyde dehydrogenase [Zobellia galactanivorans]MDO6808514.1 glutamate-5-semialdehyde dehydrogenase [Zobellia galactanivorans]OWW26347.1 gamma-glutamyl-phosphate reductase [Zobellia sp. OII3]CAZ95288.1 Gamma-glutamyl phosphate reductase [Zobellia galactanivorans]
MSLLLDIKQRNAVLSDMAQLLEQERTAILAANKIDLDSYSGDDLAMRDRLKVDQEKIDGMILSLQQLAAQEDPLGVERFSFTHDNGMHVSNKTAPFGTILIIYESRPDVTIEAAGIAFKSGNKILLKGGKESLNSNLFLVDLWHKALEANGAETDWVTYLQFNRTETQAFLEKPNQKIDLIVPRGGERLIAFVKAHATCPVIVSGRGNNFVYIDHEADLEMAIDIIINAKTTKISACNALDKVLVSSDLPRKQQFLQHLIQELQKSKVEILADEAISGMEGTKTIDDEQIWYEEFLDYKIAIGQSSDIEDAISKINTYGGGHSAAIITANDETAEYFMNNVDTAAVYHNASTRFTDGGQFGLGGELAISTDKLHQRGPIGLQHLVTNKWYVKGDGQTRR